MGIGELLDHTFTLFRRAWKPLILLGLISVLPSFLVTAIMNTITTVDPESFVESFFYFSEAGLMPNPAALIGLGFAYLLLVLIFLFLSPLWTGAFIAAAHQVVMGETVTVRSAFQRSLSRYWALLGTNLLLGLLYLVATPFILIGGLIGGLIILSPFVIIGAYLALGTLFAFRNQVIMIEGESGGIPPLKRSWSLAKRRFFPVLGTWLLFSLMMAIIGFILGLFLQTPVQLLQSLVLQNEVGALLMSITQNLPSIVAAPLSILAITLLYYDTRIRTEGLDLQMQIEGAPPESPQ